MLDAVREVVDRQLELGIDLVSDGERSRPSYVTYVAERLEGSTPTSGRTWRG